MTASNFDEFVLPKAEEAPHAVVLDWYRRLELTIRGYLASRNVSYHNGSEAENVIAGDALLGVEFATQIRELRCVRNRIAHESVSMTPAEAVSIARQALSLIGRVLRAQDFHAASWP